MTQMEHVCIPAAELYLALQYLTWKDCFRNMSANSDSKPT